MLRFTRVASTDGLTPVNKVVLQSVENGRGGVTPLIA